MTFKEQLDKLIHPDFRCEISIGKIDVPPYSCYSYESEFVEVFAIGGTQECLQQIGKEISKRKSKYSFPVTVQIFEEETGILLWNGALYRDYVH